MTVIVLAIKCARFKILADFITGAMGKEGVAECFECLLNSIPEFVSDTAMLVYTLLVVLLQEAVLGRCIAAGKSGAMDQSVKGGEISKLVAFDHPLNVELDVCRVRNTCRIPQQPQFASVGYNAPQRVRIIEVFLDCGVRAAPIS